MQWSFSIDSTLADAATLRAEVRRRLMERSLADAIVDDAQLIVDEVLTNTIEHGHGGDAGHRIDLDVRLDDARLSMTFTDDAPAFDPRRQPEAEGGAADELPVGGVGLSMVRRIADRLEYDRSNGRNCLTTIQHLADAQLDGNGNRGERR